MVESGIRTEHIRYSTPTSAMALLQTTSQRFFLRTRFPLLSARRINLTNMYACTPLQLFVLVKAISTVFVSVGIRIQMCLQN
jgi:hypothetical protein